MGKVIIVGTLAFDTIETTAHSTFFVLAARLANGAEPPITLSTLP